MMSLQLGETFSGFKIQRPVQWVMRTPNPLLSKYNELPKILTPPLVSKQLPQPWLMHLQIPILICFFFFHGNDGALNQVSPGLQFHFLN